MNLAKMLHVSRPDIGLRELGLDEKSGLEGRLRNSVHDIESQVDRLHDATGSVLRDWIARLGREAGDWPQKVTAFHPQMAVHGRFGQPCPDCGAPVQRIVYAENETNYCARCQTGGKLLADRALSRLLKASWPKSIDELS